MLKPSDRGNFNELLRPPPGCQLDRAIGTTFSLDLEAALAVPLAFALRDTAEAADTRDPLLLLESLRRHGERMILFCQAGAIHLPRSYHKLTAFLEKSLHEVRVRDRHGLFHPKVWILRFTSQDQVVRYRVRCLSRNLTHHPSWDTAVALDGCLVKRANAFRRNGPLVEFTRELPKLCVHPLSRQRQQAVAQVAGELAMVEFEFPAGFTDLKFWHGGLAASKNPLARNIDQALVVSPFLSDRIIVDIAKKAELVHLVSRPDALAGLSSATRECCESVYCFEVPQADHVDSEEAEMAPRPKDDLRGLHAKLFLFDEGWYAHVLTGSFNATNHAFRNNVEFMVELTGKKKFCGVDVFLSKAKGEVGFIDLLTEFNPEGVTPVAQQDDAWAHETRTALLDAEFRAVVTKGSVDDTWSMQIVAKNPTGLPAGVRLSCRPISLPEIAERDIGGDGGASFADLVLQHVTPFIAFTARKMQRGKTADSVTFVFCLPLDGGPEDRHDQLLAQHLSDPMTLMRFLMLVLAEDGAAIPAVFDHGGRIGGDGLITEATPVATAGLLESLLRALHRDAGAIDRVDSLIKSLRKVPQARRMVDSLLEIWTPVQQAREASRAR